MVSTSDFDSDNLSSILSGTYTNSLSKVYVWTKFLSRFFPKLMIAYDFQV